MQRRESMLVVIIFRQVVWPPLPLMVTQETAPEISGRDFRQVQRARQAGAPPPALGFPVFTGTRACDTEIRRLVWREQSAQRLDQAAASLRLPSQPEAAGAQGSAGPPRKPRPGGAGGRSSGSSGQ